MHARDHSLIATVNCVWTLYLLILDKVVKVFFLLYYSIYFIRLTAAPGGKTASQHNTRMLDNQCYVLTFKGLMMTFLDI